MRWSFGFGPFRVYAGGRRRRRRPSHAPARMTAAERERQATAQRQRAAELDFKRTRQFSGRVTAHTVYERGAVSFTVYRDGRSMNITTPDGAPQKILDLRKGDMVRMRFGRNGKDIEDLEVGHSS